MNVVDISLGPLGVRYDLDRGVLIDHSPRWGCSKRLRFLGLDACLCSVTFQDDYIITTRIEPVTSADHAVDVPGKLLSFRVFSAPGITVGEWKADESIRWLCD